MDRFLFWRRFHVSGYLVAVLVFWVSYAALSVFAPASQAIARYGITLTQGNLIRATILVPSLVIWIASMFAVVRFYKYTSFLRGSAEGTGFKKIAVGLQMLFWVLIIPGIINVYASYQPDSLFTQKFATILRNYIQVVLYFGAFWNFYQGSKLLNNTVQIDEKRQKDSVKALVIFMVVLTTSYVWAIFHNSFRTVTENPLLVRPTYFLEDWLIVLTIMIPYLITWAVAGLAIINIRFFAQDVAGIIYKKAFKSVMLGLLVIILMNIGLQFMVQAATAFSQASLKVILLIVYLILFVIAAGYLFLAKGAKELTAIEEA